MADKKTPPKTVFHRLGSHKMSEFPHLPPLSEYSRMITCDIAGTSLDGLSWTPDSPFHNIKIEILNNSACVSRKRQLDDSCLDETYETPLKKKPCLATCLSPDLACVLDSTLLESKTVTLSSPLVAEKVNNVESSSSNKVVDPQVTSLKSSGLVWLDSSNESDGQSSPSFSLSIDRPSSSPVVVSEDTRDLGTAFDFDIDEIMCLSPIDRYEEQPNSDGLDEFVQSCQSFYEEQKSLEHSEACKGHSSSSKYQSSDHVQGQVKVQGGKDMGLESDEGYLTKSFKTSKLQSESQTVTPVMSTPLDKFRQLVKGSPLKSLGKAEQCSPVVNQEPVRASSPITLDGFVSLDACNTGSFPELSFLDSNENTEGEVRSVGTSIQKSFVCHSVQQAPVVTDTVSHVKTIEDEPSVSRQISPKFRMTFQEVTDSTKSVASTLPLLNQVKIKVNLPKKPEVKPKPAVEVAVEAGTNQQPERKRQSGDPKKVSREFQRPVVFRRERDWEREKTMYVDSVVRHMNDNTGAGDGVMTELLQLMNTVANQGNGSNGKSWQHPSDLTRRNYKPPNSGVLISLDEWQNLNFRSHRRFAKVPHPFVRSPVL